jgi:hypothetical protein
MIYILYFPGLRGHEIIQIRFRFIPTTFGFIYLSLYFQLIDQTEFGFRVVPCARQVLWRL